MDGEEDEEEIIGGGTLALDWLERPDSRLYKKTYPVPQQAPSRAGPSIIGSCKCGHESILVAASRTDLPAPW